MPGTVVSSQSQALELPRDLGSGLTLRRAATADIDAAADFTVQIHGSPGLGICVRDLMSGRHPTTGAGDFVLVTDSAAGGRIMAMAGLIAQTWAYEGIPFGVGNPEFIATDPDYRRRGLMGAVMDGLHALSAARGQMAQAILGLRWFYRRFGYEYALDPGPRRSLHLSDVPALPEGEIEPYRVRRIREDELPLVDPLYRRQCADRLITNVLNDAIRRYDLSGHSPGSDMGDWTFAVVDAGDRFAGYFSTWGDPYGVFAIKELAAAENVPLRQVLPAVLRYVGAQREVYAEELEEVPTRIGFELDADHPAYELLGSRLGPARPQQDWYMRVSDLPAFLRHIAPVLEQRLARSVMHDFTGELRLTFFQSGLRLAFEQGRLAEVCDWTAVTEEIEASEIASFPPGVFLKLLFGYRSLEELHAAFPDCWAGEQDALLLRTLFPKRPSWLRML